MALDPWYKIVTLRTWDPAEGRETPWIDLARQLAGDKGVAALGNAAKTTPPGTGALANVFAAAGCARTAVVR